MDNSSFGWHCSSRDFDSHIRSNFYGIYYVYLTSNDRIQQASQGYHASHMLKLVRLLFYPSNTSMLSLLSPLHRPRFFTISQSTVHCQQHPHRLLTNGHIGYHVRSSLPIVTTPFNRNWAAKSVPCSWPQIVRPHHNFGISSITIQATIIIADLQQIEHHWPQPFSGCRLLGQF